MRYIGIIAGIVSVAAFIPQVIKIYMHKSAKDVSALMFLASSTGAALWVEYGFQHQSIEICATNMTILLLSTVALILMWRYR